MPAVSSLMVRETFGQIAKRGNWAQQEAGVVVVFCIVFIVGVGLTALFIHKKLQARKQTQSY